ncbi:hypothetical protein [Streptomyces sp. NBC_00268]|uniref:hypothetical protein n=1 Tax=Streptomyces sp. NBC_00268 TaxID=2975695 RepID=UPI002256B11F|nr:hypothetical protein [Streptomyces sp. NBC_00268]MCX5182601.1 hypothetical protein [Streptomyces sp. NBC_00268]
MSPRITLQRRVRRPRGLRVGPFLLWAVRIPQSPNFGFGRIATTDTPGNPAPDQQYARDANGRVVVVGGIAFAALRCSSVPVSPRHF